MIINKKELRENMLTALDLLVVLLSSGVGGILFIQINSSCGKTLHYSADATYFALILMLSQYILFSRRIQETTTIKRYITLPVLFVAISIVTHIIIAAIFH
jgi:hypothetical protein